MIEDDKKEYMSMLIQLMRKNGITILDFVVFGLNEFADLESYDEITKRNIAESLCDKIQDNF